LAFVVLLQRTGAEFALWPLRPAGLLHVALFRLVLRWPMLWLLGNRQFDVDSELGIIGGHKLKGFSKSRFELSSPAASV